MALTQSTIDTIKIEYDCAPRGAKTAVVNKWAGVLRCSDKTIFRALAIGRKRHKKEEDQDEITKKMVSIVFQVKYRIPDCKNPLSTDQALDICLRESLFPENAPKLHPSTINKIGKELGYRKTSRRVQRYQAEYPNQMHHVDASGSSAFYMAEKLPDGECILKLYSRSQNYKNKPKPLGQGVWLYGITDDYSGFMFAQYKVAPGESLADNLKFLEHAWRETPDKVFCGLPDKIKADKGPMMAGKAAQNFFDRLKIDIDPSVPGEKDAHGKIERPWSTLQQRFEKQFLVIDDWKKYSISLSELNRMLLIFLKEDYNSRYHRFERSKTREQAWRTINLRGGIKPLPPNSLETVFTSIKRKVDKAGCFSLNNKTYEIKGDAFDTWVNVKTSIFNGSMIAEEIDTGRIFEVIDFEPNPIGTFTAHKDTPLQKIKKESKNLVISKPLYTEEKQPTNVVLLPTRVQPEQRFDFVFPTNSFDSVESALQEFSVLTHIFPKAGSKDRLQLEQIFRDNGLKKEFIRECAHNFNEHNRRYGNV